ncbi:MAG TPA: aryl-sulfate sulfotransferase [Ilumatobacteraceae bacterium]|nr:aryl-sulfate sulfotransferase [Ilumatobacteraceae bacterium]
MRTWSASAIAVGLVVAAVAVGVDTDEPVQAAPSAVISCAEPVATEPAPEPVLESYRAINPQRLIDTRDGTGGVNTPIGAGCTLEFTVPTAAAPAEAAAVALSVTSVSVGRGFFTVFPCASGRPPTSNVNARAGIPTPNLVVAMMDSSRRVCIFSNHPSDVVVDLAGWWGPGVDRFTAITPVRAYDSRVDDDGVRLTGGAVRSVPIAPNFVPAGATAAVVNFTATAAVDPGWLVVYPCGQTPPLASNLNVIADEDRAVAAIVGLGQSGEATGRLCVRSLMDTHFVIDVTGYYTPTGFGPTASLRPLDGDRLIDSRDGTGGWTTPLGAGETRSLQPLAGRVEAAEGLAVSLNVVATNGVGPGNLRVFPCGGAVTSTSSVNFETQAEATNLVNVKLADDGTVCIFSTQQVDVVVDLFAVTAAPAGSLLTQLSFGSAVVYPEFGTDDPDYAIECGPGTNSLNLQLGLASGVTATVNGQTTTAGPVTAIVPSEGLLPVEVRRGADVDRYFFRCLPADFPRLRVERPGSPPPGWILTTLALSPWGSYAVILDERGAPVWYKRSTEALINLQRFGSDKLVASPQPLAQFFGTPDDDLTHWTFGLDGADIETLGTDDRDASPIDHHEFIEGPGDGWTIISYPFRDNVDTTGMPPAPGPFGTTGGRTDDRVVDSEIVELLQDGTRDWSWNSKDHFSPAETTFPQRFGRYPGDPPEVDLIHINSAQRLSDGDYVVSARHLDAAFRVDRDTGDLEWILGSLQTDPSDPDDIADLNADKRLRIIGDPWGGPRRPHDARFDETTKILTLFDNRTAMVGQSARAVAYLIDEVEGTATMIREIRQPAGLISGALGSARFAADGSVLVNWGQLQPMFTEVDAAGNTLLSITSQVGTFRAIKLDTASFDRATLRAAAGGSLTEPAP